MGRRAQKKEQGGQLTTEDMGGEKAVVADADEMESGNDDEAPEFMLPEDHYPNMVFVPLKMSEFVIPAREFALYLLMLIIFMLILSGQDLSESFSVNDAMKDLCGIAELQRVSTVEGYVQWWPVLLSSLKKWRENANQQGSQDDNLARSAVLIGLPFITQRMAAADDSDSSLQGATADAAADGAAGLAGVAGSLEPTGGIAVVNSELVNDQQVIPPFNATGDGQCPWQLFRPSSEQLKIWPGLSNDTNWCYTNQTSRFGPPVYYIPQIAGVLTGIYSWSPAQWISSRTLELGHHFTVFFPAQRRFAAVSIVVSVDSTGRVVMASMDGKPPSFEMHEPFFAETNVPLAAAEALFYLAICWLWLSELAEVWDCICVSEVLIPLQILTANYMLQYYEIKYHHERACEVYDPRDPRTGQAFQFPAPEAFSKHVVESIEVRKAEVARLEKKLLELKGQAAQHGPHIRDKIEKRLRGELQTMHLQLMNADRDLRLELQAADYAAVLQLSIMWKNKWSSKFPPHYLSDIAGLERDDPAAAKVKDFHGVDWIETARDYMAWESPKIHAHSENLDSGFIGSVSGVSNGEEDEIKTLGDSPNSSGGHENHILNPNDALTFRLTGMFAEQHRTAKTPRDAIFDAISPMVEFLHTLQASLSLHDSLVASRHIKDWTPKRLDARSTTIDKAFQVQIRRYNETGKFLNDEMKQYAEEIDQGFAEPALLTAETVRVKAQSLQDEMRSGIRTAGLLGLFWPGSPLWEAQGELRGAGKHSKSAALWSGLTMTSTTYGATGQKALVNNPAMSTYLQGAVWSSNRVSAQDEVFAVANPVGPGEVEFDTMQQVGSQTMKLNSIPVQGWRDWVPESAERLVSFDGQFVLDQQESARKRRLLPFGWFYIVCSKLGRLLNIISWFDPLTLPRIVKWCECGLTTYISDTWNAVELLSSTLFIMQATVRIRMYLLADNIQDDQQQVDAGAKEYLDSLDRFQVLHSRYMFNMMVNSAIMWFRLFKYIGVVPQMGILLQVLAKAGPSVLIFTIVAMIPCMGISLSYHVAFGATLQAYSTFGLSLNTLMRMAVGDFNFSEIYSESAGIAISLFWLSALLLSFVLINIFVAIIMSSYDAVLSVNPEANDASSFLSIIKMQAKRIVRHAISPDVSKMAAEDTRDLNPHVLLHKKTHIEPDDYWDIFEGYLKVAEGVHSIDTIGQTASSTDLSTAYDAPVAASAPSPMAVQKLTQELTAIKRSNATFQSSMAKKMANMEVQQAEMLSLVQNISKELTALTKLRKRKKTLQDAVTSGRLQAMAKEQANAKEAEETQGPTQKRK